MPLSKPVSGLRPHDEELLDLFDESEEQEDQFVQMEIKGWMANIENDLFVGLDAPGQTKFQTTGRSSKRSHGFYSTEEEKLMQEILEDVD